MSVGIVEVDAAAAVVVIDLTRSALARVGPMVEAAFDDPAEDLVELVLSDQERVVLRGNRVIGLVVVEREAVVDVNDEEGTEASRSREAQDLGEKGRRPLLVAAPDDRVIEFDHPTKRRRVVVSDRVCPSPRGRRGLRS
jgi:hypothetical protein